jgi:hypothetical protein
MDTWKATLMRLCKLVAIIATSSPAVATPPQNLVASISDHVAQASARFGIPRAWITAVITAESGGHASAVSAAGAIGLMQVMPATYAELRRRYVLGADPFHPADNILAGTAYLRELYERYGADGMLAAYNAGPRRWEEHVRTGRPLPKETQLYLARLQTQITAVAFTPVVADANSKLTAALFVARAARVGRGYDHLLANAHAAPHLFVRRTARLASSSRGAETPRFIKSGDLFVYRGDNKVGE